MDFLAFDVETANYDYSSICQVGVVKFKDGKIIDTYNSLVNPEDYFDPFYTEIHGITQKDVKGKPTFPEIYKILYELFKDNIVVHHMAFDKTAFYQASEKHKLIGFPIKWLDTARVVRRGYEQFRTSGYGLKNLSKYFNLDLIHHHNALEDARIAGEIFIRACKDKELRPEDWFDELKKYNYKGKTFKSQAEAFKELEPDSEGDFFGETIVFTGSLRLPRIEAAQFASQVGFLIQNSVNKKTTFLVVGQQDLRKLHGQEKSNKHKRAEELIKQGQHVRIIGEDDFFKMLHLLIPEQHEETN